MKKQSTYSLLVRSEEKGRGLFEISVCALVTLCMALSVWQGVQAPVTIPSGGISAPGLAQRDAMQPIQRS